MQKLLRELRRHAVDLRTFSALEVFGYTGEMHTREYAGLVRSLEVWEIDPRCEASLRRRLPKARVKITDSFAELRTVGTRFDLVVIDNPMATFGDGHCEHFDLFPAVFRVLADPSILILNVIPAIDERAKRRWPNLFSEAHLAHRREFYGVTDPANIPLETLAAHYRRLAHANGLQTQWHAFVRRHTVFYLALGFGTSVSHDV